MSDQPPGLKQSTRASVAKLLDDLSSRRRDGAWAQFLQQYSPLLMQMARQFAIDNDRASDCYLFVCEQLSDNGFRRLLSFHRDGPAQFSTWLKTVSANLCIDWRRKQDGRVRAPAVIAKLSPLEQAVYRLIYIQGATRNECLRALEHRYPGLDEKKLWEINARVFASLSSRQRWHASLRPRKPVSLNEPEHENTSDVPPEPADPGVGPDQSADLEQSQHRLEQALSRLEPRKRLLIRLRFQQDLTLDEVARLVGYSDPYKAHREIQAVLAELATLLPSEKP